jgi:hypothetical protein
LWADGAVDGDARAATCGGLVQSTIGRAILDCQVQRDGVREREQLQLPARGANPHCHSNFSFLDGAGHPEEPAAQAARMGIDTLAVTDHDGLYGVVRFAEAAKQVGVRTAFGTELSLDLPGPQSGVSTCSPSSPPSTGCQRWPRTQCATRTRRGAGRPAPWPPCGPGAAGDGWLAPTRPDRAPALGRDDA